MKGFELIRTVVATLALCVLANAASAELLNCKQTRLAVTGFKNKEAAESWFPKTFKVQIDGGEAVSDVYGLGTVEESKGRKKVEFVTSNAKNQKTVVKFTFIEKTSVYTAKLAGQYRYLDVPGAKGKCSVSK